MISQNWREELLKSANKACDIHRISLATLGKKIFQNAHFFPNIESGGGCGVDRYIQAINWFSKNTSHKAIKNNKKVNKD